MKRLFFFRSFFPSWLFFTQEEPELALQYRTQIQSSFSDWQELLPPIQRSFRFSVINPQGNFLHACHNHLQHLQNDLAEVNSTDTVENLTSYRLTHNLVRYLMPKQNQKAYQFRLLANHREILVSPLYQALPQ